MSSDPSNISNPPSLGPDDLLYLFFRHKWKIIFFSLIGFGVAASIYLTEKTAYRSQAKLLVRYITDKVNILATGPREGDTVRPLDPRDTAIMNAEAEILRSSDGILQAVKNISAQKVLQAYGGGTNVADAVDLVQGNLQVEIGKSSGIMVLTLSHRDQEVAQRLLSEIIVQYQERHLEIHHSGATRNEITKQTQEIKKRLAQTEAELRRQKNDANISNLEQSKADFAAQMMELRKSINGTEAELAEMRAQYNDRPGSAAKGDTSSNATPPSTADIARYNQMARKLMTLRASESELLQTFSESSKRVQQVRQEIAETEEQLKKLPIEPAFLAQASAAPGTPVSSWETVRAQIAAKEAKYQTLTNLLARVRADASRLDSAETSITQLERQRKAEEEEYAYYMKNLEEIRLDETIDVTRRNNINVIQEATRISPDNKKLMKKAGGACAAGVGLGFLLALLSDFVFNPSVKRTKELESSLRLPVLASIPDLGKKQRRKKVNKGPGKNGNGHINGEIAPWDESDPMLPYYEALRDRVVMSYAGDVHKPKIVGLTSCNRGAGVSRLCAGLAASLSRDAERNVLLVGLERNKVAVSAFAKGRPTDGIEPPNHEGKSEKELVAQNLYSLATTGRNLAGASVVQSFSDLLPKLKISDYDYIIFDLPPLTQTSGSLRLASQMERTILVVEAEQTGKQTVRRAKSLLKSSHANVFTVLNKTHSYGPRSLREDL